MLGGHGCWIWLIFWNPGASIVAGVRGVLYEALETHSEKGRRTDHDQFATIGFTPGLSYGVARAESFWSCFRGFKPLFYDVFRGRGGLEFLVSVRKLSSATIGQAAWRASGLVNRANADRSLRDNWRRVF